jgi:hypothetical protein
MEQLADFCRLLFGMVNTDAGTVADGIRDYLGTREHAGLTGLNWQLQCFTCTARTSQARQGCRVIRLSGFSQHLINGLRFANRGCGNTTQATKNRALPGFQYCQYPAATAAG